MGHLRQSDSDEKPIDAADRQLLHPQKVAEIQGEYGVLRNWKIRGKPNQHLTEYRIRVNGRIIFILKLCCFFLLGKPCLNCPEGAASALPFYGFQHNVPGGGGAIEESNQRFSQYYFHHSISFLSQTLQKKAFLPVKQFFCFILNHVVVMKCIYPFSREKNCVPLLFGDWADLHNLLNYFFTIDSFCGKIIR